MTRKQVDAWYAARKAAGAVIDIASCELSWGYVNYFNPYGLRFDPTDYDYTDPRFEQASTYPPEMEPFVRSVGGGDDDWINLHDLPPDKKEALRSRINAVNEAKATGPDGGA